MSVLKKLLEESSNLVGGSSTPTKNLAVTPSDQNETYQKHIKGYPNQFDKDTIDQINTSSELVDWCFNEAVQVVPMTQPKIESKYMKPREQMDDWSVGENERGGTITSQFYKTQIGRGRFMKGYEWSGDDLLFQWHRAKLMGSRLAKEAVMQEPLAEAHLSLNASLVNFMDTKLWDGDVNQAKNGLGLVGLKTQFLKVNETETANDQRFNATTFATAEEFVKDLEHRRKNLQRYGFTHFTLFIPNHLMNISEILTAYHEMYNIDPQTQFVLGLQQKFAEGGNMNINTGMSNKTTLSQYIDIIQINNNMEAGEAFFYPDEFAGAGKLVKRFDLANINGNPRGIQTKIVVSDEGLLELLGSSRNAIKAQILKSDVDNTAMMYKEFSGGFEFRGVGMATYYSDVQFLEAADTYKKVANKLPANKVHDLSR